MKCLLVLLILVFVFALVAFRYRREISLLVKIFRLLFFHKKPKVESKKAEELIRCVNCQQWIPASQALALNMGNFYCSKECIKKSLRHG